MKFYNIILLVFLNVIAPALSYADSTIEDPVAAMVNRMVNNEEWSSPEPYVYIQQCQSAADSGFIDIVLQYIPGHGRKYIASCFIDETKNTWSQSVPFVNKFDIYIKNNDGKQAKISYNHSDANRTAYLYDILLPSKAAVSIREGGGRHPIAFRVNMFAIAEKIESMFPLTLSIQFSVKIYCDNKNSDNDIMIKIPEFKLDKKDNILYIIENARRSEAPKANQ